MNMTTKLKNIRRIFTASALLMLLGLVSCTSETVTGHGSDSPKGEARQVRFALNMGGQGTTRATASDAAAVTAQKRENTITKLYAVVFTPDAANQLTAGSFSKTYEVTLTDMATLNADLTNPNQVYNEGTFTVDEAGLYYMFLVANPGETLEKNLTKADGATNALTTAKTVSDFYNLVESDRNPNDNSATGFLMTSKMIQLDIKGDAETDLTDTEISLTRAAARFDIDASALGSDFVLTSVKFNNRHPKTVLVNTGTNEDANVGESSSSATAPTYNKPASLPAATATMPADPAEYLSAYVWKGGIYGYENHANAQANVNSGSEANAGDGITQLIVSGTYKGIAVSQTVDFWSKEKVPASDPVSYTYTTIPVNRNTIYTVKLLPKATPDQYAPFAYTIGVADWKEGETIVYKGSDLAQPFTPELVSITREVWDETNNEWTSEKSLNLSTISLNVTDNGEARTVDAKKAYVGQKTCRLAIKVKTGTSGCNILCPELSEELAGATSSYLDTNPAVTSKKGDVKGFFETEQSSPECEYDDADGTMYQTWYVQISGKNASNQKFNFTLTNQLNSQNEYITHFQVRRCIVPDDLQYGDLIYDDCTVVRYNDAASKAAATANGSKPIGVVVYITNTASDICEAGLTTEYGSVEGKVIVMALRGAQKAWCTVDGKDEPNNAVSGYGTVSLFPNLGNNSSLTKSDLNGYYKTKYLTDGTTAGTGKCGHTHPAADYARQYQTSTLGNSYSVDYLEGSTGWFLPSSGQLYAMDDYVQKHGKVSPIASYSWPSTSNSWTNNGTCFNNWKALITTWGEGNVFSSGMAFWVSSEVDSGNAPHFHYDPSSGFHWDTNDGKTGSNMSVPVLAY